MYCAGQLGTGAAACGLPAVAGRVHSPGAHPSVHRARLQPGPGHHQRPRVRHHCPAGGEPVARPHPVAHGETLYRPARFCSVRHAVCWYSSSVSGSWQYSGMQFPVTLVAPQDRQCAGQESGARPHPVAHGQTLPCTASFWGTMAPPQHCNNLQQFGMRALLVLCHSQTMALRGKSLWPAHTLWRMVRAFPALNDSLAPRHAHR